MRLLWVFMTMAIGCYIMVSETAKAATRKFDGDFEFIEDDDSRALKKNVKKWLHDPENELCLPLNCKKSEICLLEDTFTAICISKEELNKARVVVVSKSRLVQHREMQMDSSNHIDDEDEFLDSEDDDLDQQEPKCKECPISNPVFLCGSDNKTYSSVCRLKYHNCIHNANIRINCTNFCPCKTDLGRDIYSKRLQFYGQKNYVINSKYYPDITFKSRNFNYDNQHYQYLKYSNRGKDLKYKSKNLVGNAIVKKNNVRLKSMYKKLIENRKKCPSSSRPAMANRLLDWFSVVIADSKLQGQYFKTKVGHFPIGCQNEVLWMFGHLDIDSDGKLSLSELYGLEHDQNEPCLKPFLDACDFNRDIFVSVAEWCQCFSKAERPCAAMRRRSSSDMVPNCDSKGYYQNIQCHQSLGLCWCVDQHGIEFAGTRVRGIKPNCDSIIHKINSSSLETNSVELEDDEDSSEVVEGSAQIPLDF